MATVDRLDGLSAVVAEADKIPQVSIERVANLGVRACDVLRDLIVQGTFQPGQRLNEVDLAAALGISRGPLREAIQNLASEGLVRLVPNRGAFIPTLTVEEFQQLYEVRQAIEVEAAGLAAGRVTTQEGASLYSLLDETNSILTTSPQSAYPVTLDFHRCVLVLSHNPYILKCGNELQQQVRLARAKSGSEPLRARSAHDEHRRIADAIVNGDSGDARASMRDHLRHSLVHACQIVNSLTGE